MDALAGSVLVVDDDPAILHLFTRVLAKEGYAVQSTSNSKEALGLVEARRYDLVICDINMPEVTGLEIVRALRTRDEDASAVIVTAAPRTNTAIEALELGAIRYLTKPVSFESIRRVAKEACAASAEKRKRHAAADAIDREERTQDALDVQFTRAMEKLHMAYQPIVRWSSKSIYACELLLRMDGVFENPGLMIDAAVRLGRQGELSTALRSMSAALPVTFPPEVKLFFNVAPHELLDDSFYQRSNPLSAIASRVVLEITERGSLSEIPDVIERVQVLKASGFRIAIDDLGCGYSGLSNIVKLAPDILKIDMSLVRDVDKKPVSARLVRSMLEAARDLGVEVLCEGVETVAERDTLIGLGCDLFQGYLFARPGAWPASINFAP